MIQNKYEKYTHFHSKEVIAVLKDDPLFDLLKLIDPNTKQTIAKYEIEKPREEIIDKTNIIPILVENNEDIKEVKKIVKEFQSNNENAGS